MSNLLVQNIKHTNNTTSMTVDSSGQVTIRGEGSATTTNLQQGLCKVFYRIATSNSNTIEETFNVSGFSDNGTGDITITHTNNTVSSPAAVASHVNTGSNTDEVQNTSDSSSSSFKSNPKPFSIFISLSEISLNSSSISPSFSTSGTSNIN